MIKGIHHTAISTGGIERALRFYKDLLGFEELFAFEWKVGSKSVDQIVGLKDSSSKVVMLKAGNACVDLFQYATPEPKPGEPNRPVCDHGITHLCLQVEDIDGEYERLGGGETLTCDVRVVSATNVDLPALTAAGRFRADLLDRLAFDVVTVPPLRARRSDIPVLAAHFGQGIALELGAPFHGFAPEALARLSAWDWPGNVRELKNSVERSVYRYLATGSGAGPVADVCLDPFESPYRPAPRPVAASAPAAAGIPGGRPEGTAVPRGGYDFSAHVAAVEKTLLGEALAANGGNQRRTARHLRLSYDQCRGLLRKHGLAGRSNAASPDRHEEGARLPAPAVLTGPT